MPKIWPVLPAIALLAVAAALSITVPAARADIVAKSGASLGVNPPTGSSPSAVTTDFNFNTGGSLDFLPTTGGSSAGWGAWFITTARNDMGADIRLVELGFPCAGPPSGVHGWVVWLELGGLVAPDGNAETALFHGGFAPVDADPTSLPPMTYTYIDISTHNIVVPAGAYFSFGYENTGMGGQTGFNGTSTWAWYNELWDPDQNWSRTAILQVKGSLGGAVPVAPATWGRIKSVCR